MGVRSWGRPSREGELISANLPPENIIEPLDPERIIDLPHYGGLGLTPFFWLWDACPAFAESGTGARSPPPCGLEASRNGRPARVSQVTDVHQFTDALKEVRPVVERGD
jgi:hypothetical protein